MITMHWQEWIVALLVLLCTARIGMNVISFFRSSGKKNSPCDSCPTGCEIKRLYDRKRMECSDKPEEKGKKKSCENKKCCG